MKALHRCSVRAASVLALVLAQALASAVAQQPSSPVSGPDDFAKGFDAVPCEDGARQAAVRALFEQAGAAPAEVVVDRHEGVENLVVVRPGASSEKIVVGAHYDKVEKGCGAVDNWTGVVALAHLYRTLRHVALQKTLVFVAFGKEEKGLVGSRALTRAIPKEQLPLYCAMVNIDSLGLGPPQVADNMSSRPLEKLAAGLAKEMDIPFGHAAIGRASSDSVAFIGQKIPAITLHGMNNQWASVLHSDDDQASKVNATSVYLGYRLALAMIARIDGSPCAAFR